MNNDHSGKVAFDTVVNAMDWLEGMYGPQNTVDYVETCEALIRELTTRMNNARNNPID